MLKKCGPVTNGFIATFSRGQKIELYYTIAFRNTRVDTVRYLKTIDSFGQRNTKFSLVFVGPTF